MNNEIKKPIVVFLSSPFTGLTDGELMCNHMSDTSKLTDIICKHYGVDKSDIKILCTSHPDGQSFFIDKNDYKHKDLYCVGKSIGELMASCDVVVFGHNWRLSTGCMVEQYTATIYGLDYIDLDHPDPYVHTTNIIRRGGIIKI